MKRNINRYILASVILFNSINCFAFEAKTKKKITVSIPPIASLTKMIVGDMAEVDILQKVASCPHHHSMKPSEISKIKEADYIVFISENFEVYLKNFLETTKAKKLSIDLALPRIHGSRGKEARDDISGELRKNYHFWLDIDIALSILESVKNYFEQEGFDSNDLNKNYIKAKKEISKLKHNLKLQNAIIVGESLYYLTPDDAPKIKYFEKIPGFKMYHKLEQIVKEEKPSCLIYDGDNRLDSLLDYTDLIELDIEDWNYQNKDLKSYYIHYINSIYDEIKFCGNSDAQ